MLLDWIILIVVLVLFGTFAISPLFDKWGDSRHGSWIIPKDVVNTDRMTDEEYDALRRKLEADNLDDIIDGSENPSTFD